MKFFYDYLKNKININLLIVLVIPSLISGPFLSDLIVSLSSLIFLIYLIKNKNFRYFYNKFFVIFFIFFLYCTLNSIFVSEELLFSLKSSLTYIRIGLFSCFIWYLIDNDRNILKYFYFSFLICFSFLILDSYIQYFFGSNLLGWPARDHGRISSFFDNELIMGSYLSRLFPLLLALFLIRKKNKIEKIYFFIIFFLTPGAILMSAERTSLVFFILSFLFILILINNYKKLLISTSLIVLILFGIMVYSDSNLQNRIINAPIKSMNLMDHNKKKYIFTYAHDSLIRTAYKMFLDKPIFGHGPKMFRVICKDEKYLTKITPCTTHPHNFYIQLLAETGILGFLFLFSALMYVMYCALRQLKTIVFKEQRYLSDYQVCLLACFLITVWPLSSNGNFFNNWLMICYSLPIGFYLHSIYGKNKEELLKE